MSGKLGFTFYPKDWWTSDSFFDLNTSQRYIYLECLFIMYANDGYMKTQKTHFQNRIRIEVSDIDWNAVTDKFIKDNDFFTHISVNKRMRQAIANRANGSKGGRPPKPKKPILETQKNPSLEIEIKVEKEKEYEEPKFIYKSVLLKLVNNESLVDDYISLRKLKKAPTTKTQLEGLIKECQSNNFSLEKALEICIQKNWQGFEVKWLKQPNQNTEPSKQRLS